MRPQVGEHCVKDTKEEEKRQVERRRLGNQPPVLGKANSPCEVGMQHLSLQFNGAMIMFRWKNIGPTNSRFLRFFVRSVPLFPSLMLTPMRCRM